MGVAITLITGFLGAGKSTLINRIVREHPNRRFGLVVNEFGDVKLESQIIDAPGSGITELPNGCMCCVVRSDLIAAVESLRERDPAIDHIIIEASGLSDPVPIAATFLDYESISDLYLDSIVCVVDAERFLESLDHYEIAAQQILFSDYLVISKLNPSQPAPLTNLIKAIQPLRPKGRIFPVDDSFSTDLIIDPYGGDHGDIRNLEIAEHDHGNEGHIDHDDHEDHEAIEHRSDGRELYYHRHERVETMFYTTERSFLPESFGQFLNSLPSGLARAKGFVQFGGPKADGAKYLLQVVGARPDLERRDWAAGESRRSALVFIGRDIDPEGLRLRLDACLEYSA